jgi:hypothetical protein
MRVKQDIDRDAPPESTSVPSPNQASSQESVTDLSMDLKTVRTMLGMEEGVFEWKTSHDPVFYALAVTTLKREINHRLDMEKINNLAIRLMSTDIFMTDAKFANSIEEIVRLTDPTDAAKAPF